MIRSVPETPGEPHRPFNRRQSILLVFLCTVLGAAAQVFMKIGGAELHSFDPIRILTNVSLLAGYSLYGVNTVLLMIALRDGELSKLYPIIALTYVWVNILSIFFFHEPVNAWKVCGIASIMVGVTFLGRAGSSKVTATEAGIIQ